MDKIKSDADAMKKLSILFFVLIVVSISCEDVIEVDVPTDDPRLVVNALMRVDVEEEFVPVEVRVTLTNNFFEEIPIADVQSIIIIQQFFDEDGLNTLTRTSTLVELEPGTGVFTPDPSFDEDQRIRVNQTEIDVLYTMVIEYDERRYAAQTRYVTSVPIDNLEIGDGTLFGEEETELIVTFTDDPDRNNYYVFDFGFNEFLTTEDQFFKGQEFTFSYFYDQEFEPGTVLEIGLLGADQNFYNYMDLLIQQTEDQQGPFQTPVATARGNVFDVTGLDNIDFVDNVARPDEFALGYFAIVQEYRASITIE